MPKAAFVYHPLKTDLANLQAQVLKFESQAGWASSAFYPTTVEEHGTHQAKAAVSEGANVVVAVGGDGTVREVVEALQNTNVALGILPMGSGNVLCRNLGLPLNDIDAQLRAIFSGTNRMIDVGRVSIKRESGVHDKHVFLVLAGMGLDARTIKYTKTDLKKRLGWLAYVDAGLRTMVKDKPLHVHYRLDGGGEKSSLVYSVMFGNCGILPGGLLLIPDATVDDGLLDLIALRPVGPFSWLRIWGILSWENGVLRRTKTGRKVIDLVHDTRYVTYKQTKHLDLRVDSPEPIQLDGDDFGIGVGVTCTVDPLALPVRVLPEWNT